MLVIDRVELIALDKPQQVLHLDDRHSAIGQQQLHAANKIVQIGHMGHHIVGNQHVGLSVLGDKFAGRRFAKKPDDGRNSAFLGGAGDVGRRLDAQARNASLDEIPQKITVITCDFDDETL